MKENYYRKLFRNVVEIKLIYNRALFGDVEEGKLIHKT